MSTITNVKAPTNAKFFSSKSNARRALKKYAEAQQYTLSAEQVDSLIKQEHLDEGGRFWYSEAAVSKLVTPAIVKADKEQLVQVASDTPKVSKARSVTQNGVRQPIRGVCADVWAACTNLVDGENPDVCPTLAQVKELAAVHGWNLNNVTIEFYGWRKFHGYSTKK